MVLKRKKTCTKCGRYLWLRDFYKTANGWRASHCKECCRQEKREEYARNRKKPDRIYKDFNTDQLKEHKGCATRIFWTEYMLERLKRNFATTKNEDLALDLNVSPRTMIRKARELGLVKDKDWQVEHARKNCRYMRALNKCVRNSGMIKPGERKSPATEFKKKQ